MNTVHFIKLKSIGESKLGADKKMLELGHQSARSWVTGQHGVGSQGSVETQQLQRHPCMGTRLPRPLPVCVGGAGARQHNPLCINTCTHTCTPALRSE